MTTTAKSSSRKWKDPKDRELAKLVRQRLKLVQERQKLIAPVEAKLLRNIEKIQAKCLKLAQKHMPGYKLELEPAWEPQEEGEMHIHTKMRGYNHRNYEKLVKQVCMPYNAEMGDYLSFVPHILIGVGG